MRVVVRGRDQLKPPLLDTDEASAIEFRDPASGELKAIFARGMFGESTWMFVSCSDKDWPEAMRLLGYSQEAPQEAPDA